MDPTYLLSMGISFGTSLATNLGSELLAGPMSTLNDWWYVNFGHKTAEERQLLELHHQVNLEKLKTELLSEVTSIPLENLQEPKMNIIAPALEASKNYIDEESIRTAFAKLIASSFDNRKNDFIHHSFTDILKQMTPLDAKILKLIGSSGRVPIGRYFIKVKNSGSLLYLSDILILESADNLTSTSISLANLNRLGLISLELEAWISDDQRYEKFYNHELLNELQNSNQIERRRITFQHFVDSLGKEAVITSRNISESELNDILQIRKVELKKGLVETTSFGSAFLKVCS